MEPPAAVATDPDRTRTRLVAFAHPLAAAIVMLCGCLVGWRPSTLATPDFDPLLRLFPFDSRWDARIGVGVAALAVLLVTVFARGPRGRRLRRALGLLGLAIVAYGGTWCARTIRSDCRRWEGCDFWHVPFFLVDALLLLLAATALLVWARHEPGPRLRWFGAGAVLALAIASAAWTYRATPTLRRYTGDELSGVRLQGFFETNNDEFVPLAPPEGTPADPAKEEGRIPPAIPALPMQGDKMLCFGDWRVVKFPDRDRCLPLRPMVKIAPDDVEVVTVAITHAGGAPEIAFTLRSEAAKQFAAALRATGSFHFVLLNAHGALIADVANPWPIPGPVFVITPGKKTAAETERLVRLFLGLDLDRPPPKPTQTPTQTPTPTPTPNEPAKAPAKLDLSTEMRGTAPACAFVEIAFDRRGWPTNFSNRGFDGMTSGQADHFQLAAPPGASPRMYTKPGLNTMFALFDGDRDDLVLARCRQTVAAYLPKAPHMPLIAQGSATHVVIPCQPCR